VDSSRLNDSTTNIENNGGVYQLRAWKRATIHTSDAFTSALDLMDRDVSIMQEIIEFLGNEGGLLRIRRAIQDTVTASTAVTIAGAWTRIILPLFTMLTQEKVVESILLEQSVAIIYRALCGVDGKTMRLLFDYVDRLLSSWPDVAEALQPQSKVEIIGICCNVFCKILETSTPNMVSTQFKKILGRLENYLQQEGKIESFHHLQASKFLDYAQRRLSVADGWLTFDNSAPNTMPVSNFTLPQELPGTLSSVGPRHDNDHASIVDIKILPTSEEIFSVRQEYLPALNPDQWHVPGIRGLLDRNFRLVREDTVEHMRAIIQHEIEDMSHTDRRSSIKENYFCYRYLYLEQILFDRRGFKFVVRINQPSSYKTLNKAQRRQVWQNSKRLQEGALVCAIDQFGAIIFFVVSESTCRVPTDLDDLAELNLSDDRENAYLHLELAEKGPEDAKKALIWAKTARQTSRARLIEFTSVMLQSVQPNLEALQSMYTWSNLPFQEHLVQSTSNPKQIEPSPPIYSRRPGFYYDLSQITTENVKFQYCPGDGTEAEDLASCSTLDIAQAKAVLDALKRGLACIQGPPGTGKSYTGESLIRVLLNSKAGGDIGPILCVCYTNHALDQLLEHMLDHGVKIIRIGSRSKSTRIAPLGLLEIARQRPQRTRPEARHIAESTKLMKFYENSLNQSVWQFHRSWASSEIEKYLRTYFPRFYDEIFEDGRLDNGWEAVTGRRTNKIEQWLKQDAPDASPEMDPNDPRAVSLFALSRQDRHILYKKWVANAFNERISNISDLYTTFTKSELSCNRVRLEEKLRLLQEAEIIGVTTTGLASNMELVRKARCKVLVCEEAGEVLESHILTALLPSIEHAILIGDHLQLRPQIKNWRLQTANPMGRKYALDRSLFERLVSPSDGLPALPFSTLQIQRRMHPSISRLIRSSLYPSLEDATNVMCYDQVAGMRRRLFWLDHEQPESGGKSNDDDSTSHSNPFEVEMVSSLVSHLIRQGIYGPGQIAVLTPYVSQLKKLREKLGTCMQIVLGDRDVQELENTEKDSPINTIPSGRSLQVGKLNQTAKASSLQSVRIATVDNFQGEEAEVVIISLVRSNKERGCGFLKTSNRINVLLSRAKHGMYIIGNSGTANSVPMWAGVIDTLKRDGNFGQQLQLQCQRHPDTDIAVSEPEHFSLYSPDGGCTKRCDVRLDCGHACPANCHSEILHQAITCQAPCTRKRSNCDHSCNTPCGMPCPKNCMVVLRNLGLLLGCGHKIDEIKCWQHQDMSSIKCLEKVKRVILKCKHEVTEPCWVDVDDDGYRCRTECNALLECGHTCSKRCHECPRVRILDSWTEPEHGSCRRKCDRAFPSCKHCCQQLCHDESSCPPCTLPCDNQCAHSKCKKRCGEVCVLCSEEKCPSRCPHSACTMPYVFPFLEAARLFMDIYFNNQKMRCTL
jgi:hypothetical protein